MTKPTNPSSTLLCSITLALLCSCASEKKQTTWETSGHTKTRTIAADPAREAADAFTDDACVAKAEDSLETKPKYARALMLQCMHRPDFMLITRLAEPEWKGIDIERKDWDALIAAYLRRGSADAVDLSPLGIRSRSLVKALEEEKPKKGLHMLHALVVNTDEKGAIVRPIVYEATDRTVRREETIDMVDRQGTVLEKGVNVVREEKTGTSRVSQTLDERVFIAVPGNHTLKKGETWVMLVDDVAAPAPGSDRKLPDLSARLVAGAPVGE